MPPPLRCTSVLSSTPLCTKQICTVAPKSSRPFSTTPRYDQRITRARRAFWRWLSSQGANFKNPLPNSTNYLGAYNKQGRLLRVVEAETYAAAVKAEREAKGLPVREKADSSNKDGGEGKDKDVPKETARDRKVFPLNRNFISQTVLSDEMREAIYRQIMSNGKTIRQVSTEMRVEMSRVGAIYRLKMIEKEWKRIGKPLATPYADAVMSMLPQTEYKDHSPTPHESINDLPVHASTRAQIFHPTSESRQFTRADAARVFNKRLLPADERIPHPEMVLAHREQHVLGLDAEERLKRAEERAEKVERAARERKEREERKEKRVVRVQSPRWEFRFTPVNVENAGKTGRGHYGVGWRYGVPFYDRSRGQVKIPTSV